MHPQLMRAAGDGRERQPCQRPAVAISPAPAHGPLRDRGQSVRVRLLPPAALGIAPAERHIDRARSLIRATFDNRPIGLVDFTVLEQQAEMRARLAVTAEHEAAGRVAIQPMRQNRRARQAKAQRVEIILQRRAAFIRGALRTAMHRNAGRLVDHQHQSVTVQKPRLHDGGGQAHRRGRAGRFLRLGFILRRGCGFRWHGETAITAER